MLTDEEFRAFLKTLGARVRSIRKQKGLKLREIMIATGYYDAQWRKYESGGSLNVASLMKIALALDVSLGDLLDGLKQWPMLSVAQIQKQHGLSAVLEAETETDIETDAAATNSPRVPLANKQAVKKTVKKAGQPTAAAKPASRPGEPVSSSKRKSSR